MIGFDTRTKDALSPLNSPFMPSSSNNCFSIPLKPFFDYKKKIILNAKFGLTLSTVIFVLTTQKALVAIVVTIPAMAEVKT